jgi:hypothetical protein
MPSWEEQVSQDAGGGLKEGHLLLPCRMQGRFKKEPGLPAG